MAIYGNLNYFTRINPETGRDYPVESRQRVFISYRKVDVKKDRLCENTACFIFFLPACGNIGLALPFYLLHQVPGS